MLIHFTFNMDDGYLRYELVTNKNEKIDYTIDVNPNLPFSLEGYNELYVAYNQWWFDIVQHNYYEECDEDERKEMIDEFREGLKPTIIDITNSLPSSINSVREYIEKEELNTFEEEIDERYNKCYVTEVNWRRGHDEERYSRFLVVSKLSS